MVKLLTKTQIDQELRSLDRRWKLVKHGTILQRTIATTDFISSFTLVARVTIRAEVIQHHPDIWMSYGRVKVSITTHDQGGLTKKDIQLASAVDDVYNKIGDNPPY